MKNDIVKGYIKNVLRPQLVSLGVTVSVQRAIAEDVSLRLTNLLSHWGNMSLLEPLLNIGAEEGHFYEPLDAPQLIKDIIVVGVRNSLIEDLQCDTRLFVNRRKPIGSEEIKTITGAAIKYYSAIYSEMIQVQPRSEDNLFSSLPGSYPFAWRALSALCHGITEAEVSPVDAPLPVIDTAGPISSGRRWVSVIESGVCPSIGPELGSLLGGIRDHKTDVLFVDSFKVITRNTSKLFKVINFVLGHGGSVISHNFYLSPTYVARRRPFIRPAHMASEMSKKLLSTAGLTEKHSAAINQIRRQASL